MKAKFYDTLMRSDFFDQEWVKALEKADPKNASFYIWFYIGLVATDCQTREDAERFYYEYTSESVPFDMAMILFIAQGLIDQGDNGKLIVLPNKYIHLAKDGEEDGGDEVD